MTLAWLQGFTAYHKKPRKGKKVSNAHCADKTSKHLSLSMV